MKRGRQEGKFVKVRYHVYENTQGIIVQLISARKCKKGKKAEAIAE